MKQLYKDRTIDGIGFSKNGYAAFLRGEKPERMFKPGSRIVETAPHHIEVKVGTSFKRSLVMFYKEFNL